jgi:hypothetical protein
MSFSNDLRVIDYGVGAAAKLMQEVGSTFLKKPQANHLVRKLVSPNLLIDMNMFAYRNEYLEDGWFLNYATPETKDSLIGYVVIRDNRLQIFDLLNNVSTAIPRLDIIMGMPHFSAGLMLKFIMSFTESLSKRPPGHQGLGSTAKFGIMKWSYSDILQLIRGVSPAGRRAYFRKMGLMDDEIDQLDKALAIDFTRLPEVGIDRTRSPEFNVSVHQIADAIEQQLLRHGETFSDTTNHEASEYRRLAAQGLATCVICEIIKHLWQVFRTNKHPKAFNFSNIGQVAVIPRAWMSYKLLDNM